MRSSTVATEAVRLARPPSPPLLARLGRRHLLDRRSCASAITSGLPDLRVKLRHGSSRSHKTKRQTLNDPIDADHSLHVKTIFSPVEGRRASGGGGSSVVQLSISRLAVNPKRAGFEFFRVLIRLPAFRSLFFGAALAPDCRHAFAGLSRPTISQ